MAQYQPPVGAEIGDMADTDVIIEVDLRPDGVDAYPLPGFTWEMQWRTSPKSPDIIAAPVPDTSEVDTIGIVRFHLSRALSRELGEGRWFWDVRRTMVDAPFLSVVWPWGTIVLSTPVTRDEDEEEG